MKRMLSVWLPAWPIARLSRAEPGVVPAREPFALVDLDKRGIAITAVNEAAASDGISPGTLLADARAAIPHLAARPAEKSKDGAALFKLAQWAGRYGPSRNLDGEDGFWADTTGVAHLFGGEKQLVQDLVRRLAAFSIPARAGLADTLGAAHALARHGLGANETFRIAPRGTTRAVLASLPVEALRIDAATVLLLRRLGLKRIGQLYNIPRESLAQRFRSEDAAGQVLTRLDAALGAANEPLKPFFEAQAFAVRRAFPEPLISSDALETFIQLLCDELAEALKEKDKGTRALFLAFYRADGTVGHTGTRMRAASNEAAHFKMLLKQKFAKIDAGFGVDLLVLEATQVSSLKGAQSGFAEDAATAYDPGPLIDRLSNRLTAEAVTLLRPRASHIPERGETRIAALTALPPSARGGNVVFEERSGCGCFPSLQGGGGPSHFAYYEPPWPYGKAPPRPAFLLQRPELISVVAEVPDGPPARFVWRRVERKIARAEGPERIAPEWWRSIGLTAGASGRRAGGVSEAPNKLTAGASGRRAGGVSEAPNNNRPRPRDYYRIEADNGDAFWVFRHGLYGGNGDDEEPGAGPCWYLHGVFA